MKKVFLIIGLILLCFSLVGCSLFPRNEIVTDDYFEFELRHRDGYAILRQLTELGEEQSILSIPAYVKGLPVQQIGVQIRLHPLIGIRSVNLMKVYIPYTVTTSMNSAISTPEGSVVVLQHYSPSEELINSMFWATNSSTNVFYMGGENNINVQFLYNYSDSANGGFMWLDIITNDIEFLLPSQPTREGYIFKGWFLDEIGNETWSGTMPNSADETLRLYAKWSTK